MSPRRMDDSLTHVSRLSDGGELVIRADHGRIYLDRFTRGRRSVLTTPLSAEAALRIGQRMVEMAALAPSTGEAR